MARAVDETIAMYPKTYTPSGCKDSDFELSPEEHAVSAHVEWIIDHDVVKDSSPGVPAAALGKENKLVMLLHKELIIRCVIERLRLLSVANVCGLSAHELVQCGLCDPIRLFVKQEPHDIGKIRDKRYRLIASLSVVDQIVERILSGVQNRQEISQWESCPSKPGIGFTDEMTRSIWMQVIPHVKTAMQTDIQGWDWSVQQWELDADAEMRIRLAGAATSSRFAIALRNRVKCLGLSVFSLSDGTLIEQCTSGIQKSGSYNTSSSNSRMRVLAARLAGSNWCVAMGDDCVEQRAPGDVAERYLVLGHRMKMYEPCGENSFTFCSQNFQLHPEKGPVAVPENWSRTFYRLLCSKGNKRESLAQFVYEMRHSPMLVQCLEVLVRVGWDSDNAANESTRESGAGSQAGEVPQ